MSLLYSLWSLTPAEAANSLVSFSSAVSVMGKVTQNLPNLWLQVLVTIPHFPLSKMVCLGLL